MLIFNEPDPAGFYSLLQYLLVLFIGFLLLMNAPAFSLVEQLLVVLFVLYSSVSVGLVLKITLWLFT
jgi:alkylglycerol monooxygenase